jgi:hypothetical protein
MAPTALFEQPTRSKREEINAILFFMFSLYARLKNSF